MITTEWEATNSALQTRPLLKAHTGVNLAKVLKLVVLEWEFERANDGIAVIMLQLPGYDQSYLDQKAAVAAPLLSTDAALLRTQ